MSFNPSGWSIRRPVPTLVLFLVLMIAGVVSFSQLGIDANPNIELPYVTIQTAYPGAGPQELESQFTRKVENAIAGLSDVEEIYSSIGDGSAYTNVRFAIEADGDRALEDVRNALDGIRQELVPYAEGMTIQKLRYDDGAVLTYAVRSDERSVAELSNWVDRTIEPALMAVKGVAEVQRIGGVSQEIRVDLDPGQLSAYGISAAQVNEQVKGFNVNLPGGRSQIDGQEQSVRAVGRAPDVPTALAELRALPVVLPAGGRVPLESLATISDGEGEVRQSATVNNQPVVSFAVLRGNGSLLVSVEDGVKAAIAQLKADTIPEDIELQLIFTRATDVREAYQASIEALIFGSVLAVVVVGLFLRNWRTTLITAAALPLSIIPTFIVIHALGYSLNSMTLLALTLAVGNLVDDAIVEIENIERHLAMGKPPPQAALESSAEVGLAVVTTTATIVAVFLPVALMGGIPGQFFKPFGVTVAVATMFSTLVARFMTPLMAAKLLLPRPSPFEPTVADDGIRTVRNGRNGDSPSRSENLSFYRRLLSSALRHRLVTLGLAIALFAASLSLIPHLPTSLYGAGDTELSHLSLELPPGTSLEQTEMTTARLSEQMLTHPDVESVYVDRQVAAADVVIRLERDRTLSRQQFEQQARDLLQSFPDLRFNFDSQGASGSDKALNLVLTSADATQLDQTAQTLAEQMRELPGLVEVGTSTGQVKPEVLIVPNTMQAADLGVSLQDIAATATLATLGDRESNLADVEGGDRTIPIRVRLAQPFLTRLETLADLQVPGRLADGGLQLVPLSAVAEVTMGGGPAEIRRFDRERQISVSANLADVSLGQALEAVYALPIFEALPQGVSEQATGDADILQDVFRRFELALGMAILAIYAVLVLLYNSFIYPLAVMAAMPLGIGGTFLVLLLAQKPLDLYALIGIVLLMGLVTKNSILLVDYALLARDRGQSLKQAVVEAGTTRLRPILMTSISTIAGMVPIALELGAGGEVRSPMAIAVIGGFSTATLLTLIVVPVCFTYIAGLQQRLKATGRWFGQLFKRAETVAYRGLSRQSYFQQHHFLSPATATGSLQLSTAAAPMFLDTQPAPISHDVSHGTAHDISYETTHDLSPVTSNADSSSEPPLYALACIDDDAAVLNSVRQHLDDTIFKIISVNDPMVALTDVMIHQPDIILLTQSMPGLDGYKVCDRLRKSPFFRTVPILMLVRKRTWWTRFKASWYGASGCLEKPLDRTQLLVKLFLLMV